MAVCRSLCHNRAYCLLSAGRYVPAMCGGVGFLVKTTPSALSLSCRGILPPADSPNRGALCGNNAPRDLSWCEDEAEAVRDSALPPETTDDSSFSSAGRVQPLRWSLVLDMRRRLVWVCGIWRRRKQQQRLNSLTKLIANTPRNQIRRYM